MKNILISASTFFICVVLVFLHNEVKKQASVWRPSLCLIPIGPGMLELLQWGASVPQHCLSAQGAVLQGALQAYSLCAEQQGFLGE